jgi:hypothetical protein
LSQTILAGRASILILKVCLLGSARMQYAFSMTDQPKSPMDNARRKGGQARAASLSSEKRVEIASTAARARWARRTGQSELPLVEDLMMNTDAIDAADMLVSELAEQAAILSESGVAAISGGKLGAARLLIDAIERTNGLRNQAEELKSQIARLHDELVPNTANAPDAAITQTAATLGEVRRQDRTDPALLNKKRNNILNALEAKHDTRLRRWSAAMYRDDAKHFRVVCTMSKWHLENQNYWYAFHPHQNEFLSDAEAGLFVLGMMNLDCAVVLPLKVIEQNLDKLNTTVTPEGRKYWHVHIARATNGTLFLQRARGEAPLPLTQYILKLPPNTTT